MMPCRQQKCGPHRCQQRRGWPGHAAGRRADHAAQSASSPVADHTSEEGRRTLVAVQLMTSCPRLPAQVRRVGCSLGLRLGRGFCTAQVAYNTREAVPIDPALLWLLDVAYSWLSRTWEEYCNSQLSLDLAVDHQAQPGRQFPARAGLSRTATFLRHGSALRKAFVSPVSDRVQSCEFPMLRLLVPVGATVHLRPALTHEKG
ncbi:hypothetical protein CALCODRAFT_292253 [Calocera cornea HHB12733]|uniref:Uncharacterized protein n=1 Tax=Calocera cornea HHB12733 TaxID=1353952 RepID=A0A165FQJ8_9BASI|nr:hypothetical protein CALCODRAFT_292253 [Calocera cornea HHB12733]